jgi:hypothetical protein
MIEPKHKNCIAERDWLRREYEALKGNYDRVRAAFEGRTIEIAQLRAQRADANEIARQAVDQAKAARDEIRALTESPERVEYVSHRLPGENAGGHDRHCSRCGEAVPGGKP